MKDDLKSYVSMWIHLACSTPLVEEADIITLRKRVNNEGLPFLVNTMPSLGKEIDKSLLTGKLVVNSRFKIRNGIPVFLQKLFRQIYDKEGMLKDRPETAPYVKHVRQLLLLYYKLEDFSDDEKRQAALANFIDNDDSINHRNDWKNHYWEVRQAKKMIRRVLCDTDPFDIIPRHGPGATACRTKPWDKWHTMRYIKRLDDVFPYSSYFYLSPAHLADSLNELEEAEACDPGARVVLVPKDSRGPRVISCEPLELQYIQQGLMRSLYSCIESHPLTSGFVNFTNQSVNRDLAHIGSIDGSLATLDLKDASDMVSNELVKELFPSNWVDALQACRSEYTTLPNGEVVQLNKFAPMGSAVCFPIEALIFYCVLRSNLDTNVWVYGDDIILDREYVDRAIYLLETFGFKVNREKSCYTGFFRESCGAEFFHGFDISYVKCRKAINRRNIVSLVDFANLISKSMGEDTGKKVLSFIEDKTNFIIPRVCYDTNYEIPLVFFQSQPSASLTLFRRRWSMDLQRWEYRVPIVKTAIKPLRVSQKFHWREMMRKLLTQDAASRPGTYVCPVHTVKYGWRPLPWTAGT